jgi:hypothetical protein
MELAVSPNKTPFPTHRPPPEDEMPYVPFHDYFPEIAERETRTVTILQRSSLGLPPAQYGLVEMFCDEPGCDCRRVMFSVISSVTRQVEAVVAYGWESPRFYARWFGENDPLIINEMRGPILNLGSPRSRLAPAILAMVKEFALSDAVYMDRVKRHYALMRERIDGPKPVPWQRTPKRKKKRKG